MPERVIVLEIKCREVVSEPKCENKFNPPKYNTTIENWRTLLAFLNNVLPAMDNLQHCSERFQICDQVIYQGNEIFFLVLTDDLHKPVIY